MHTYRARRTVCFIVAVAAVILPALTAPAQTLEERLERIAAQLEARRVEFETPGMSIAIVKDDEVIMARGFGEADLATHRPATEKTLYAIGSTTKAFTAALVAMLADEGTMSLDDPVRRHLPDYRLSDPEANEKVVIRDLMCHRIGLAAMNMLWYGNDATSEEVLAASYRAEMLYPFREKWNYSNVSFLAAGAASAAAAGTGWDDLLRRRLLEPLGMDQTNTTIGAARSHPEMASGYLWNEEKGRHVKMQMRDVAAVAPAGAINSSVLDMARWLRLQLGRGELEGRRLYSEAMADQMWTKHSEVGGDIGYGLGWLLREWEGRRVVDHAGGIDGFTAEVAMLPDEHVGFVLLMNRFGSPLQELSREIVFDGLLGDWDPAAGTAGEDAADREDFGPYIGNYTADFFTFDNATFEVMEKSGRLAVDVPGQMTFELEPPDADGWRVFTITDTIRVRFNRHEGGGDVYSMTMLQGGYAMELPRQDAEYPPGIELDEVRPHLGLYRFEQLGGDIEVLVQHNRLAVDVPGQMVCELHPPDETGRWVFRPRDSVWVIFNGNDAGETTSVTFVQDGNTFELPRVGESRQSEIPTVDELMKLVRRGQGGGGLAGTYRSTGTIRFVHMGVSGMTEGLSADGLRRRDTVDLGRFGTFTSYLDGDHGWMDARFMPEPELGAELVDQLRVEHPAVWTGDWREFFETVRVKGRETFDDREVYAVGLTTAGGLKLTVFVDVERGLVVGRRANMLGVLGSRVMTTYRYGDFREVDGVRLPFHFAIENAITGKTVIDLDELKAVNAVPDAAFRMN